MAERDREPSRPPEGPGPDPDPEAGRRAPGPGPSEADAKAVPTDDRMRNETVHHRTGED